VAVLIENGGQGSATAAPVAKKVLEKFFEREKINSSNMVVLKNDPGIRD